MQTITWYGRPIKTMVSGANVIQYCEWNSGARLYAVNGRAFHKLDNAQFSRFLNIVLKELSSC